MFKKLFSFIMRFLNVFRLSKEEKTVIEEANDSLKAMKVTGLILAFFLAAMGSVKPESGRLYAAGDSLRKKPAAEAGNHANFVHVTVIDTNTH